MKLQTICLPALLWVLSGAVLAEDSLPQPQELFQQLDKNQDGKLEAGEIPEAQKRFFERLVRVADKNQDGNLSEDEFIAGHQADTGPNLPLTGLGGQGGRGKGDVKQRFQMLDRNKDGKLTRSEVPEIAKERLGRLFDRVGKDELTLEEFQKIAGLMAEANRPDPQQLFARLDTNKDGKLSSDDSPPAEGKTQLRQILRRAGKDPSTGITKEEFLASQPAAQTVEITPAAKEAKRPQAEKFFQRLDKDRDGKLSPDEAPERIKKNFQRFDANNNGFLTPDEMPARPQMSKNNPDGKSGKKRPESE